TAINGDTVVFTNTSAISSASVMNLSGGALVFGAGVTLPTSNFNLISGGLGYGDGILNPTFTTFVNSFNIAAGTTSLLIDSASDASTNVNFNSLGSNASNMALGANGN